MVKMIRLFCVLEGQKEGIPEQPEQSITGMVPVPLGMEISISPRAGSCWEGWEELGWAQGKAPGSGFGSQVGAPGAGQGGQCWARCSPAAASAGRGTSGGMERDGSSGQIPAAFNQVFEDKSV